MHISCYHPGCEGFEFEIEGPVTNEVLASAMQAQSEHQASDHGGQPAVTHIRKRINPRRVKGDGFYKVQLSAAENGSQTLCGDEPTTGDMGFGETRWEKNMQFVTCERCKELRRAA